MIGIDIVEVSRIKKMVTRHGDRFLSKVYTSAEIEYAKASPAMMYQRLAVRFAAKEAVVKAFGTGFREITWKDIEVLKDDLDKPYIRLSSRAVSFCDQRGIAMVHISLSHTRTYAVAQAALERKN